MFDSLANPTTLLKLVLKIAQTRIVTNCKEPLDEDEDYSKEKHNPKMPQIILTKNCTMTKGEDHIRLEMLVDC